MSSDHPANYSDDRESPLFALNGSLPRKLALSMMGLVAFSVVVLSAIAIVTSRAQWQTVTAAALRTERTNAVNLLTLMMVAVSALLVLVSGVAAFWLAGRFAAPVRQLMGITRQFAAGQFDQRVAVDRQDEIGSIASGLNSIADQLQARIAVLEAQIAARTRDLETITQVNAQISTILDQDWLLQHVVDLTKERFNLYHSQLYLVDDAGSKLVLKAAAAPLGQQMVANERSIDLDYTQSIVASAGRSRRAVMINDVGQSTFFLSNPLLPETRSELAVPLIALGQLIGVLDVQSDKTDYFDAENFSVLVLLAGQIAIAVQNARAFTQIQQSREEVRQSQMFLDSVVENIPAMVFVKDAQNLRFVRFNRAGEELLGIVRGQYIGKNDYDFFPQDEAEHFIRKDREVLNSGTLLDIPEEPIQTLAGEIRYLHTRKIPMLGSNGKPEYLLGISEDITEWLQQEEAVREARAEAEILFRVSAGVNKAETEQELVDVLVRSNIYQDLYHLQLMEGTYNEFNHLTGVTILADWREDGVSFAGAYRKLKDMPFFNTTDRSDVYFVDDVAHDPRMDDVSRNLLLAFGDQTFVAVPLFSGSELIGGIVMAASRPRPHTEHEKRLLRSVAEQMTTALARMRYARQTARRAAELATVAQVSSAATSVLEVDVLLQRVADLTRERFDLYQVDIYLMDEAGEKLVLAAGSGETGRMMAENEPTIPVSDDYSLVARAARTRLGVISNNVTKEANFRPNPLLPYTKSELAIPMIIADQMVGVMDVQASVYNRFTIDDLRVKTTLAEQAAIAIQNARAYQRQLETAERLRDLDRLKSEFLANMSHELRTPLNSIIGYSEVLLDGIDGELTVDAVEDVTAIFNGGRHLLSIINDILDLAKIEAGQMRIERQETDLLNVVNAAIHSCQILADQKHIKLEAQPMGAIPHVNADPVRLKQIVLNLVNNAIKFTEKGGVVVEIEAHDERSLAVRIVDSGIGLSPQDVQGLFQQFHQVDGSATRRAGGTGLGLVITRHLIDMQGGEIFVESEKGKGSTFWFTLPIFAPHGLKNGA